MRQFLWMKWGICLLLLGVWQGATAGISIKGSKHDLSTSGYYAGTEGVSNPATATNEICIFCHTPHGTNTDIDDGQAEAGAAAAPLWNRRITDVGAYQVYQSDTMNANCAATPSPVTLVCLSCHDEIQHNSPINSAGAVKGVDVHNVVNPSNASVPDGFANTSPNCYACHNDNGEDGTAFSPKGNVPGRWWQIGPDLRNDHPVSIVYADAASADPSIRDTPESGVRLYAGRVECPSCHNVHDPQNLPFLRVPVSGSTLCYKCHDK